MSSCYIVTTSRIKWHETKWNEMKWIRMKMKTNEMKIRDLSNEKASFPLKFERLSSRWDVQV